MHSKEQETESDPTDMKIVELSDKDFRRNTVKVLKEWKTRWTNLGWGEIWKQKQTNENSKETYRITKLNSSVDSCDSRPIDKELVNQKAGQKKLCRLKQSEKVQNLIKSKTDTGVQWKGQEYF